MNFLEKLGLNIKKLREDKKLTQAKLAEISETSTSTIARLELGEGFATLKTFENIAKGLDTNLETIFNVTGLFSNTQDFEAFIEQLKISAKSLKTQVDYDFIINMVKSYAQTQIDKENK